MSRRRSGRKSTPYNVKEVLQYVYSIPSSVLDKCEFLDHVSIKRAKTGMPRYVLLNGKRLFTIRAHDGIPTLSRDAAILLHSCLSYPFMRVFIRDDLIVYADVNIPKGVDVIIVDIDTNAIGVGRTRFVGNLLIGLRVTEGLTMRETVEQS